MLYIQCTNENIQIMNQLNNQIGQIQNYNGFTFEEYTNYISETQYPLDLILEIVDLSTKVTNAVSESIIQFLANIMRNRRLSSAISMHIINNYNSFISQYLSGYGIFTNNPIHLLDQVSIIYY